MRDPTTSMTPLRDPAGRVGAGHARLQRVAQLLDSKWRIPGTGIRFGADAVLSLIPGVGPIVPTVVSAYLIWEAHRLGVRPGTLLRMAANVGFDALISAVPLAGSIGDVFFRANLRNIELLRRHLDRQGPSSG